jgi:hypothetical protein
MGIGVHEANGGHGEQLSPDSGDLRAVSGKGIGQIDPLVNDHFSRLRPTI